MRADHLWVYENPEPIAGRIPDIVATKQKRRRVVEIKEMPVTENGILMPTRWGCSGACSPMRLEIHKTQWALQLLAPVSSRLGRVSGLPRLRPTKALKKLWRKSLHGTFEFLDPTMRTLAFLWIWSDQSPERAEG